MLTAQDHVPINDVARMRKPGRSSSERGGVVREAGNVEGDAAEVVAVTTRGRVGVPSRLSSKDHTQEEEADVGGNLEWSQKREHPKIQPNFLLTIKSL